MTKDEIMTGIHDADCKPELTAHIDMVEIALDRGECDYSADDWEEISHFVGLRIREFEKRVIH